VENVTNNITDPNIDERFNDTEYSNPLFKIIATILGYIFTIKPLNKLLQDIVKWLDLIAAYADRQAQQPGS